MRLVFEISHLRTATPATVSRAGSHCFSVFVSYFSSQYCGFIWLILKRAFSARLGYRLLQQPQTHRGQKGPSVSTFFWSVDCLFVRCWFVHTCLQHWRQRCVQLYLKLSFYDKKLCVLSGSMWQFICMMHYFIVCVEQIVAWCEKWDFFCLYKHVDFLLELFHAPWLSSDCARQSEGFDFMHVLGCFVSAPLSADSNSSSR